MPKGWQPFFSRRPQNISKWTTPTSKNAVFNFYCCCNQHLRGQGSGMGGLPPCPNVKLKPRLGCKLRTAWIAIRRHGGWTDYFGEVVFARDVATSRKLRVSISLLPPSSVPPFIPLSLSLSWGSTLWSQLIGLGERCEWAAYLRAEPNGFGAFWGCCSAIVQRPRCRVR